MPTAVIFQLHRYQMTCIKQNGGLYTGSTLDTHNEIRYQRNLNGYAATFSTMPDSTVTQITSSEVVYYRYQNGGQWSGSTSFYRNKITAKFQMTAQHLRPLPNSFNILPTQ